MFGLNICLKNKLNCFYNFDKSHMAIMARVHFWIFYSFLFSLDLPFPLVLHYFDCCNYMINCQVFLTLLFLIVLAILFLFHIKNVPLGFWWELYLLIQSMNIVSFSTYLVFYFLPLLFVVYSIHIIHIFVDLYLGLTSSCKWLLYFKLCLLIVHC